MGWDEAVAGTCGSGHAGRGTQVEAVAGTYDARGSRHAGRGAWVRTRQLRWHMQVGARKSGHAVAGACGSGHTGRGAPVGTRW